MKSYNQYTEVNDYRPRIEKFLRAKAAEVAYSGLPIGASRKFTQTMWVELDQGERVIGYNYLGGTSYFTIDGTIERKVDPYMREVWRFDLKYTWKDTMNKNMNYVTDPIKTTFADIITAGAAAPYDVEVIFHARSELNCTAASGRVFSTGKGVGWPFK